MRRIVLDAQYSVMTSALTMALKHGRPDFQVQNAGPKTKGYCKAMPFLQGGCPAAGGLPASAAHPAGQTAAGKRPAGCMPALQNGTACG